jgi:hypothetical protein
VTTDLFSVRVWFRAAVVASVLGLATSCGGSEAGNVTGADSGAKCGSAPRLLVDYVQEVPDAGRSAVQVPEIAVNGADMYYLLSWNYGLPLGMDGALFRIPLGGGKAVRLASIAGGGNGLLATPTGAIVVETEDGGAGAFVSIPAGGGPGLVLAAAKGQAQAFVTDGQNVYFADTEATKSVPLTGGSVRTIAGVASSLGVADGTLYLADFSGGTIASVPTVGGPVTVLATNQVGPEGPMRCGSNLCWLNFESAFQISLMRLAPGGTPVVLASGFSEVYDWVFDGNNFFVTSGAGGLSLDRIPSDGGVPAVAESEIGITSMALDNDCLYWASLKGISALALSAADVAGNTDQ